MTDPTAEASARKDEAFDLEDFLPFLLNQAAEATSSAFQPQYRDHFGLSRTQWRVLAITGRYRRITSRDIGRIAHEEKSKVSRAVAALEAQGLIRRQGLPTDRRAEELSLTPRGQEMRDAIGISGKAFETVIRQTLGQEDEIVLRRLLNALRCTFDTPKD